MVTLLYDSIQLFGPYLHLHSNIQKYILQYNHDGIQKKVERRPFEKNGAQFGVISGENQKHMSCFQTK